MIEATHPPLTPDERAVLKAVKSWAVTRTVEALAAKSKLSVGAVSAALDGLKARTPPLIYRDPGTEGNSDHGLGWCNTDAGRAVMPDRRFSLERAWYELAESRRNRRREAARRRPDRDPALTQPRGVRRERLRNMRSRRKHAEYRVKRGKREELGRLRAYYTGYAARIDGRQAMPPKGSAYDPYPKAADLPDDPREGPWYDGYEAWCEGWEAANKDFPE
jgi:hypothetical protein